MKALFQAALERPADERAAFLAAATGDDEALRREVESLLTSDTSGVSFLEQAETLLADMTSEQLAAISRHPAGDRMNRRCLTHTIEHLGLHLGHIEVTIDWYKASQVM